MYLLSVLTSNFTINRFYYRIHPSHFVVILVRQVNIDVSINIDTLTVNQSMCKYWLLVMDQGMGEQLVLWTKPFCNNVRNVNWKVKGDFLQIKWLWAHLPGSNILLLFLISFTAVLPEVWSKLSDVAGGGRSAECPNEVLHCEILADLPGKERTEKKGEIVKKRRKSCKREDGNCKGKMSRGLFFFFFFALLPFENHWNFFWVYQNWNF